MILEEESEENDNINEEFEAFASKGKKKNKGTKSQNPDDKQNPQKKQVLKIKDKLKIIEYVEEGHTILSAAEKFHVPRTTIGTWIKSKDTLRAFKNTDKKTMHPGAVPKYKIKFEILSNLKELNCLFNEGEEKESDDE